MARTVRKKENAAAEGEIGTGPVLAGVDASLHRFMRYFLVHINPILHRTEYRGRSYSEYEIVACMALTVIGPSRPVDLSRGLRIEKGTLTSVLRRLRELGLIERRAIPGDERSYQVALTPAGRAFGRHLDAQRHRGLQALFAGMAAEELSAVARGFDLVSAYLQSVEDKDVHPGQDAATGA